MKDKRIRAPLALPLRVENYMNQRWRRCYLGTVNLNQNAFFHFIFISFVKILDLIILLFFVGWSCNALVAICHYLDQVPERKFEI